MSAKLIRHRVFQELREDIMSCDLQPGAEVRESELAARYAVSKSPIRDALQKLEFEGLVEILPRKGHRVAPISISDAADILELRETLEAAAVRKIVAEASDDELSDLDRLREADTSSMAIFAKYNRDFHTHISGLAKNARMSDMVLRLMDNYERLCIVSLSYRQKETEAMIRALRDHNEIIDALQARDGSTAARLSRKHIRKSHGQVMRGLQNSQVVQ